LVLSVLGLLFTQSETWTLGLLVADITTLELEAFHMKYHRQILRI